MDVSYAPAMAAATMVKSIVGDDRSVLPVVVRIDGEYGLDGISLAFSADSGEGLQEIIEIPLTENETSILRELRTSQKAARIRFALAEVGVAIQGRDSMRDSRVSPRS